MAPIVLALIGARLRAAGGRHLAVVAALATAAVIPVVVSASAAVTADAALGRGLAGLPAGERSVIVSYSGFLDAGQSRDADTVVRDRLPVLGDGPIHRQVEYRALADSSGQPFTLAGTDDLASAVRLTTGRLPRTCTPTRCEVVVIDPADSDPVLRSGYGLVVVGHAVRTDPLLLTGTFTPAPGGPLVLADGVDAVAAVEPLALIQRSFGWVAPLDRTRIRQLGVEHWITTATTTADRLAVAHQGLALTTPDATIRDEADRAAASARRFGLLVGSCAVLLLGTALVGGAALRPSQTRFTTALRRRGLAPMPIRLVVAGEALTVALVAVLAGLLLGTVAAAGMAAHAGLPVAATAGHAASSVLADESWLAAAAFVLLAVTLWPRTGQPGQGDERESWRALSAAAGAGLLAVLLTVSRGGDTAGGSDPLLIVLPALVLLTLGLATARAWPWAVRAGYRVVPRRAVGSRLGIAGIAARPLLAAATVGLLAAAVGATGFAASYRSTLLRGATDQAAFTVPLDVRLVPGSEAVPVLTLAPLTAYQALAPGTRALPLVRQAGSLRDGSRQAHVVQFLGLDPEQLPLLRRWPNVVGASSPQTVARAITVPTPAPGEPLPAGKSLRVALGATTPPIAVTAWLRADDGRESSVALVPDRSGTSLSGALPTADGPWHLATLSLSEPTDQATYRQHALGEGTTGRDVPSGRIDLRAVDVDGRALANPWSGWSGTGLAIADGGASAVLNYRLIASTLVVTATAPAPGDPASGQPLPVAADPDTAAQGTLLTLTLNGSPVQARVVATLPRFPTVTGSFVVADRRALSLLSDRTMPGTGQPSELWLDLPEDATTARAALASPPFAGAHSDWATDLERSLRTDPVGQGAVQLLVLTAVLTLLVALAALVLLVVGERFEDSDELYTWEANGVAPGALRQALWIRAVLVTVLAVPLGVLGGLILTRLTARLVDVTAGAQHSQPPLVPVTGLETALPAVLIGLILALAAAGLVALTSFREPLPVPGSGRVR